MSIELKPEEATLRDEIIERMGKARKAFAEMRIGEDARNAIREAGERSHKLHMLLKERQLEPKHHAYMIKNRGLDSDNPEFYMHFHPIDDLLKFIDNEHANDDPTDQTIGQVFTFTASSRRWGHSYGYKVTRTVAGWDVSATAIAGPCDKGGRPFLFEKLRQDSINYPEGLDGWMEWLWSQAETKGLTTGQVQEALQELAEWVSKTDESAPIGGVWEGY